MLISCGWKELYVGPTDSFSCCIPRSYLMLISRKFLGFGVGASVPTMRGWSGCASSRSMHTSAPGFHPASAMATTTAIGASQVQCGVRSSSSSRVSLFRVSRVACVRKLAFGDVRCEAGETSSHLEEVTDRKSILAAESLQKKREWLVVKERAAGVFLGCVLLVASVGLGLAKPSLAHPSAATSSSSTLQEEEDEDEEVESAKKDEELSEEKDPAELVLLRYLQRHPNDEKTLEGLLYVRLRKGSVARALETVDHLLEVRPDHAPWLLIRAQSLEFLGDLDAAREAFERILERDPLSARALQGLATVMTKAGEETEMLEMLRRAVQTAVDVEKPKEAKNLRMLLGQMYTLQGNLQEALATYQELANEDPKDFRPYLCQGLVYSLLDQKEDAEKAFIKYRRRCPKSFPERGYLDDLMIGAKTEARKQQMEERLNTPAKDSKKKKKPTKPLQQPHIQAAFSDNPAEEDVDAQFAEDEDEE